MSPDSERGMAPTAIVSYRWREIGSILTQDFIAAAQVFQLGECTRAFSIC